MGLDPPSSRRLTLRPLQRPGAVCLLAVIALLMESAAASAMPTFDQVRAAWRPSEAYLLDRNGEVLQSRRLDFKVRRLAWTALPEISGALIRAIIAGEDRRFRGHGGVDWRGLAGAMLGGVGGGRLRGASTLTMQLASMLEPSLRPEGGGRNFRQKLGQIRAALELEKTWSKDQILEAYLNQASFRGESQGVAAAARALFGKHPSGLSEAESLVLAAVLPSPNADASRIARKACAIAKTGAFSTGCDGLAGVAWAALTRASSPPAEPELAPHLAQRYLLDPGQRVRTTLDAAVQRQVLDILGQQLAGLSDRNVRDGAALVVDNASGEVLAYVGSAGPHSRSARVDGVLAPRQAGSTLKPFLYGLAIGKRYLTAASILDDAPLNLATASGLYIPQNYDREFKGLVSARTALAGSLNIPAIRVLMLAGVARFRDRLREHGYLGINRSGEYYGYSLALGSAEVSLLEQVTAFRSLANGGIVKPLRFQASEPEAPGRRVMSEQAAFIVSDILADPGGRAVTFGLSSPLATRFWTAVKTGTSKDMRDNWCIGFSRRYTVGVWVGNFEGDSMHDVSGVSGAAPAWAEIMSALHGDGPVSATPVPAGVIQRRVRFAPALEPERLEWFVAGTEVETVRLADPLTRPPRIDSPAEGTIIALDPDIPAGNQAVIFSAAPARPDLNFVLDGQPLAGAPTHKWQPHPGVHRLALTDGAGKTYDSVRFTVRPLNR